MINEFSPQDDRYSAFDSNLWIWALFFINFILLNIYKSTLISWALSVATHSCRQNQT